MKIKSIQMKNIGCIFDLYVPFNDSINIICGPNGVGKSTILESITAIKAQSYGVSSLKKSIGKESGNVEIEFFDNEKIIYEVTNSSSNNSHHKFKKNKKCNIIYIGRKRDFSYEQLSAIPRDPSMDASREAEIVNRGAETKSNKGWLANRIVYSHVPGALKKESKENTSTILNFFSILDKNIKFYNIDPQTNDILIDTPSGRLTYEFLSSGFKSSLSILMSIAREIEYSTELKIKIEDYDGIVLIDEIELHMHPEWQSQLYNVLGKAFPKAQFILTTHSPHVIQSANRNSIIPLETIRGDIRIREVPSADFGFQGWSIEEILTDVMGMESVYSKKYNEKISAITTCIESHEIKEANRLLNELESFLHPDNPIKKILHIQLAGVRGND